MVEGERPEMVIDSALPAMEGVGSPVTAVADEKLSAVMAEVE